MTNEQYVDNLRVFNVNDDEEHWYVGTSDDDVRGSHTKLFYTDTGEPLPDESFTITELAADEILKVDGIERTAGLWAQLNGSGLLASTCF